MRQDPLDLRQHGDTLWTLFSLALVIVVSFCLGQHFWQAEQEFARCMKKAGNNFWKQQECHRGK